ncbi:ankyrin repeat domain-containing protein [Rickettsiales bacterium]|nr:ankyrin repeat domain-containing protein [Rickettsiales bacterium]
MIKIKNSLKKHTSKLTKKALKVVKLNTKASQNRSNIDLHNFVIDNDVTNIIESVNNNYKIINQKDHFFKTALDYALVGRNNDILNDLVLLGARVSMCFYDCKNDNDLLKILETLDQVGYNFNNIDCLGFAPIHYASGQAFEKSVKFLIEKKVDINIRSIHGETALKFALRQNRSGLITGDC